MKCAVETCTNEAEQGYSLYQEIKSPTTHYTRVGHLCTACFEQLTGEKVKSKESKQIKYCIECGKASKASSPEIIECPFCHGWCCVGCMMAHEKRAHAKETQEKEDEKLFRCTDCKKPLSEKEAVRVGGTTPYCAGCYIIQLMRQTTANQTRYDWRDIYGDFSSGPSPETWLCRDCKRRCTGMIKNLLLLVELV